MTYLQIGATKVTINKHAAIQTDMRHEHIREVLERYEADLPYRLPGIIIKEHTFDAVVGEDPVAALRATSRVRYAPDPNSKAQRHNQQPVPFMLGMKRAQRDDATIYLKWIDNMLNLVRAHYGSPYPPFPFASSASSWPGYCNAHDNIRIGPGVEGCRRFWQAAALYCTKPDQFNRMSTDKPDWLM